VVMDRTVPTVGEVAAEEEEEVPVLVIIADTTLPSKPLAKTTALEDGTDLQWATKETLDTVEENGEHLLGGMTGGGIIVVGADLDLDPHPERVDSVLEALPVMNVDTKTSVIDVHHHLKMEA